MGMVCVKNNIALSSVAKKAGCKDALSLFIWGLRRDAISTNENHGKKISWQYRVYVGFGFPFGNTFDTVWSNFIY